MRVKICGITNIEDALAACDAGADALGFIFAEEARKRNRYIAPGEALKIIAQLPTFVTTVAVCVNESADQLKDYLTFVDRVQLHGEETPAQCEGLGNRAIKAFRVSEAFKAEDMLAYDTAAYLLDASVAGMRGGSGQTCDWTAAARAVTLDKPIILAGGLTPDNVAEAIQAVGPHGVDTAGGVESAPGKKDHERIRNFIRNAKQRLS